MEKKKAKKGSKLGDIILNSRNNKFKIWGWKISKVKSIHSQQYIQEKPTTWKRI